MAIRALNSVVVANYDVPATETFHAGAALGRDLTGADAGLVRAANRASDAARAWVGFASDDHARTGNTIILADPVGSTYTDGNGNLIANNNGFYVGDKRAIGDFQDEVVTTVTNLTDVSSGFASPRRGVGVFTTPSGQFVTDQFAAVETTSSSADDTSAYTFVIGDLLTFGAGANAGKLVHLASNATTHGPAIAKVDKYDSTAGLLYFTQL